MALQDLKLLLGPEMGQMVPHMCLEDPGQIHKYTWQSFPRSGEYREKSTTPLLFLREASWKHCEEEKKYLKHFCLFIINE